MMEVDLPNESTESITEDHDYSTPLSAGLRQLMTGTAVQVQKNDDSLDLDVTLGQRQQNAWKIVQETDDKTGTVLEYASNQPIEEQVVTDDKTDTVLECASNQPIEEQVISDDKTDTVLENSSNQPMEEQEITDDKTDTVLKNSSNQPMEEQEITDDKTGTVLENSSNQSMEEQVIETEVVELRKQPLFGILPRRLEEHYYQPYQSHPVDLSTSLRDVINILTFFKI